MNSEMSKLLESSKTEQYAICEAKAPDKERVMAFPDLPSVYIPQDQTLDDESKRVVEIYMLYCTVNDKMYVGRAYSHKLASGRYRKHGAVGRFRDHVNECTSPSRKKKQCFLLNNAIKKYGPEAFAIIVLKACSTSQEGDLYEDLAIKFYNSMYPHGYNLKTGGKHFIATDLSKDRVASGVREYYKDIRLDKFTQVNIDRTIDPVSLLHPLNRYGSQYGWYLLLKDNSGHRVKTDFGGMRESLEDSKKRAIDFVKHIQEKDDVKICSDTTQEVPIILVD